MITEKIEKAVATLNKGELVAIPTETVYGLAANAFSESAVKKIFELKKRPSHNPLIVHIHDIGELDKIACNINGKAVLLASKYNINLEKEISKYNQSLNHYCNYSTDIHLKNR